MSSTGLAHTAPDLAEPVRAWRVWLPRRTERGYRLESVVTNCLWPARRAMVAGCLLAAPGRWDHPSPDTECRCGIYAVADLQALRPYLAERSSARAFSRALGIVSLWGKVVRHEQGWRAARGYPARLWLPAPEARGRRPSESEEIARGFADYGIPVELVEADSSSELVDYLSEIDYSSDSLPRAS